MRSHEGCAFASSFFERLESDAPIRFVTQGPDPEQVLESIKRNITQLLNTRSGDSLSTPELGLADFNDVAMNGDDLASSILCDIRHCLEKYEPRISDLDIRAIPDNTRLLAFRFHILGTVNFGALFQKVQINLLLDNSNQYRVI